jgi:hypothetical protein
VYAPSLTKIAEQAAAEMKIGPGGSTTGGKKEGSGFTDEKNPNIKKPGDKVKPGPSGKVGEGDEKK